MDFSILNDWKGDILVNDTLTTDFSNIDTSKPLVIKLMPRAVIKTTDHRVEPISTTAMQIGHSYRITVKAYMTKPTVDGSTFDFMEKYNNNVPMPLRVMVGEVVKETKGMVYMKLHGDIWARTICTCMCCGRPLTNPISQYFGIGPECGGHNYVSPFDSEEELKQAVSEYKAKLHNITWEGWVIKSAITECVENE